VAGVVRSRVCGESERVGSERSSSRPTATRLSGALCSVEHAAENGGEIGTRARSGLWPAGRPGGGEVS